MQKYLETPGQEALGAGRRLQVAPNCSQPLLLLRPRAQQSVRATRRLRRLAQLPGRGSRMWRGCLCQASLRFA